MTALENDKGSSYTLTENPVTEALREASYVGITRPLEALAQFLPKDWSDSAKNYLPKQDDIEFWSAENIDKNAARIVGGALGQGMQLLAALGIARGIRNGVGLQTGELGRLGMGKTGSILTGAVMGGLLTPSNNTDTWSSMLTERGINAGLGVGAVLALNYWNPKLLSTNSRILNGAEAGALVGLGTSAFHEGLALGLGHKQFDMSKDLASITKATAESMLIGMVAGGVSAYRGRVDRAAAKRDAVLTEGVKRTGDEAAAAKSRLEPAEVIIEPRAGSPADLTSAQAARSVGDGAAATRQSANKFQPPEPIAHLLREEATVTVGPASARPGAVAPVEALPANSPPLLDPALFRPLSERLATETGAGGRPPRPETIARRKQLEAEQGAGAGATTAGPETVVATKPVRKGGLMDLIEKSRHSDGGGTGQNGARTAETGDK